MEQTGSLPSAQKLPFGHHGANHPVRCLASGKIEITSQCHSYTVNPASLAGTRLVATHQNLLDGTAEGLADDETGLLFGVQYTPESGPSPRAGGSPYDQLVDKMRGFKAKGGLQNA